MNPTFIVGIVAFVAIYCLWTFVFAKKMGGKHMAAMTAAQKKFEENKDALTGGYLKDDEKYGMLQKAVEDEKILGIASYGEPKTVGKSMTEGLKTAITNVKKVNMAQFFMVITDKHLHLIVSNGQNVVDHAVLDLSQMKNVTCSKASALSLKNMATGVDATSMNTLKFKYKDTDHSYNLYKMLQYYPRFTVHKNSDGQFYRSYPGVKGNRYKMTDPETQMEMACEGFFYNGFKEAMNRKFGVTIPQ